MTPERPPRASDFDYELPAELIAQRPPAIRGESRLLVLHRARSAGGGKPHAGPPSRPAPRDPAARFATRVADRHFADLVDLVPPGDLLVLNSTRVRHARLLGRRPSGAPAEVLLIHAAPGGTWVAMGQPGSALRPGKRIALSEDVFVETLELLPDGNRLVRITGAAPEEAIARFGRLPLPPYITREPDPTDDARYQTVYAEREGSVAAPTAGLHFSAELLAALRHEGVAVATLDLEVGPGTFKPVETDDLAAHVMHPERYEIPQALAEAVAGCRERGGAIWAVGTTAVRALESSAEPDRTVRPGASETALFITPGCQFRVVDHLITNFHLPRSTLLMLVCAFGGTENVLRAYRHAISSRYRFYSYGDAMLILGTGEQGPGSGVLPA